MPMYEYECKKCGRKFNLVLRISEHDKKNNVRCPKCSSREVLQRIEPFFAATSKKS